MRESAGLHLAACGVYLGPYVDEEEKDEDLAGDGNGDGGSNALHGAHQFMGRTRFAAVASSGTHHKATRVARKTSRSNSRREVIMVLRGAMLAKFSPRHFATS